jgi:hypothetical protein
MVLQGVENGEDGCRKLAGARDQAAFAATLGRQYAQGWSGKLVGFVDRHVGGD